MKIQWTYIDNLSYPEGLSLQKRLLKKVMAGVRAKAIAEISDKVSASSTENPAYLLLVEHAPVITVGRFGKKDNLLLSEAEIRSRGVHLERIDRGGDVTYHGPGQLVGYPILSLRSLKMGVKTYIHNLEETLMALLAVYGVEGIEGGRKSGRPGVWVGDDKAAAIGVYISRGITMHGFALNVSTDLEAFDMIVPCGMRDMGVTSIEKLTGSKPSLESVATEFAELFRKHFNFDAIERIGCGELKYSTDERAVNE